jgi:hypothetical protein
LKEGTNSIKPEPIAKPINNTLSLKKSTTILSVGNTAYMEARSQQCKLKPHKFNSAILRANALK